MFEENHYLSRFLKVVAYLYAIKDVLAVLKHLGEGFKTINLIEVVDQI